MSSELLSAGVPAYDENRGAFNLLLDQRPEAIALPSSAEEVAEIVRRAAADGKRVSAQRTGHGADPLGALDDVVLVRTGGLGGVEIDAEARTATVGAGALWGDVVPAASEQGLAARHGSTPTVGVAGYHLGGGVGWYARKHGLACNAVRSFELVDAGGELRTVDAESEPELFWALRGGGGDFGVVTALSFELLPIASVYAGALFFPVERASEVLQAYREWTDSAPEETTSVGRLLAFPPFEEIPEPMRGQKFAIVEAVHIGEESEGAEVLAPLRELGPAMDTFASQPPAGIAGLHMDPPEPGPALGDGMLLGELDDAAIDAWVAAVGPDSGSPLVSVELRHTGGALSRPDTDGGVLDCLRGSFLQFAVGIVPEPGARQPVLDTVERLEAAMEPWSVGRLRSFSLNPVAPDTAFAADKVERLRVAKAKYDPEGLFLSNQVLSG